MESGLVLEGRSHERIPSKQQETVQEARSCECILSTARRKMHEARFHKRISSTAWVLKDKEHIFLSKMASGPTKSGSCRMESDAGDADIPLFSLLETLPGASFRQLLHTAGPSEAPDLHCCEV
eukprot:1157690-Pelagomonas_calceolata.AAC.1